MRLRRVAKSVCEPSSMRSGLWPTLRRPHTSSWESTKILCVQSQRTLSGDSAASAHGSFEAWTG
jgi:hypothetical protein